MATDRPCLRSASSASLGIESATGAGTGDSLCSTASGMCARWSGADVATGATVAMAQGVAARGPSDRRGQRLSLNPLPLRSRMKTMFRLLGRAAARVALALPSALARAAPSDIDIYSRHQRGAPGPARASCSCSTPRPTGPRASPARRNLLLQRQRRRAHRNPGRPHGRPGHQARDRESVRPVQPGRRAPGGKASGGPEPRRAVQRRPSC
ncbi:MAG: hypothetical protein MZW92_27900 [Comamonadaceae bacterium]|nr:hypothetical protein [Comamonadaceae bacterium]